MRCHKTFQAFAILSQRNASRAAKCRRTWNWSHCRDSQQSENECSAKKEERIGKKKRTARKVSIRRNGRAIEKERRKRRKTRSGFRSITLRSCKLQLMVGYQSRERGRAMQKISARAEKEEKRWIKNSRTCASPRRSLKYLYFAKDFKPCFLITFNILTDF